MGTKTEMNGIREYFANLHHPLQSSYLRTLDGPDLEINELCTSFDSVHLREEAEKLENKPGIATALSPSFKRLALSNDTSIVSHNNLQSDPRKEKLHNQ